MFFIICCNCLLVSCFNNSASNKIHTQEAIDTLPSEVIENFEISYSENGSVKFTIIGKKAVNWKKNNELIFPDGFFTTFYEPDMSIKSTLQADFGINNEKENKMIAKDNVVLVNYNKSETLNAEELVWDQTLKKIFSDKFVKITSVDDVIYGNGGFESDETFDVWTIKQPNGDFIIKED